MLAIVHRHHRGGGRRRAAQLLAPAVFALLVALSGVGEAAIEPAGPESSCDSGPAAATTAGACRVDDVSALLQAARHSYGSTAPPAQVAAVGSALPRRPNRLGPLAPALGPREVEVPVSLQQRARELHTASGKDNGSWPWAGTLTDAERLERRSDSALWKAQGQSRQRFHQEVGDQVHLIPAGPYEMVVKFTTGNFVGNETFGRTPPKQGSFVRYGRSGLAYRRAFAEVTTYTGHYCPDNENLFAPAMGPVLLPNATLTQIVNSSAYIPKAVRRVGGDSQTRRRSQSYNYVANSSDAYAAAGGCIYYGIPTAFYQSPFLHSATLQDLVPGMEYHFQIMPGGRLFSFRQPPAPGSGHKELRIGVWGDPGVTDVSVAVSRQLLAGQPDLVLLTGDFAYADGYNPIWDLFGQAMEPLLSAVPMLGVPGDHEITTGQELGKDYLHRYTPPYQQAGSTDPFWYSYEIGLVHVLAVSGSFSDTSPGSPQFQFIKADLESVNRTRTPWIVFVNHIPWYNSNDHHHLEGVQAQADLEWLLYKHGVDVVLNGHVHSYERSHRMFNFTLDDCGPMHMVTGSGGNFQGLNTEWLQGPEFTFFSAFRSASFGGAILTVHNEQEATWEWRRTACGVSAPEEIPGHDRIDPDFRAQNCSSTGDNSDTADVPVDRTTIVRNPKQCPNRESSR